MPSSVRTQIQREKLLAREVLFDTELKASAEKDKTNLDDSANGNGLRHRSNLQESLDLLEEDALSTT